MKPRRPDQRTRILEAIRLVVFEQGYLGAKIGEITSRAGVSRATFYEHFDSKESCFLAAYDLGAVVTCERIAAAVALGRGRRASRAAITALVGLAEAEPHTFMCLTHEATVAGPTALSKREELLEELGRLISDAEAADASGRAPDMATRPARRGCSDRRHVHQARGRGPQRDARRATRLGRALQDAD